MYNNQQKEFKEFEEKIVQINRVSKKTKGGNRISFSVLVIAGDKKGKIGVGLGKALDVNGAMKKAISLAQKTMVQIEIKGTTIAHEILIKKGAAKILLKPAPVGTGIIAGGVVRMVMEIVGIRDIVSKILGSNNKASNIYATIEALKSLKNKKES
ncbi:MAG: 30S ribosomal protein S5 [Candidatus Shapirobacteria bacterium]|nr:30S ribosomal protein S5 [Candidatus Shapirobacteria bacterium]